MNTEFTEMKNWSIGVRSLLSKLKYGGYETLEDINSEINKAVDELESARRHMRDLYMKRLACIHPSYKKATYTIQKRLIGCVRVNERVCDSCDHLDHYQEDGDGHGEDRPEWAKDAAERYYNNNI